MPAITFKAKTLPREDRVLGPLSYKIPALQRHHLGDQAQWRGTRIGHLINTELWPAAIKQAFENDKESFHCSGYNPINWYVRQDAACVTIKPLGKSGYMSEITITLDAI